MLAPWSWNTRIKSGAACTVVAVRETLEGLILGCSPQRLYSAIFVNRWEFLLSRMSGAGGQDLLSKPIDACTLDEALGARRGSRPIYDPNFRL